MFEEHPSIIRVSSNGGRGKQRGSRTKTDSRKAAVQLLVKEMAAKGCRVKYCRQGLESRPRFHKDTTLLKTYLKTPSAVDLVFSMTREERARQVGQVLAEVTRT